MHFILLFNFKEFEKYVHQFQLQRPAQPEMQIRLWEPYQEITHT